eukprot:scaffold2252_cov171-Ochromonas_danica.AAC.1
MLSPSGFQGDLDNSIMTKFNVWLFTPIPNHLQERKRQSRRKSYAILKARQSVVSPPEAQLLAAHKEVVTMVDDPSIGCGTEGSSLATCCDEPSVAQPMEGSSTMATTSLLATASTSPAADTTTIVPLTSNAKKQRNRNLKGFTEVGPAEKRRRISKLYEWLLVKANTIFTMRSPLPYAFVKAAE